MQETSMDHHNESILQSVKGAKQLFEQWAVESNQGYDLSRCTSGRMQTYEDEKTEHAWRGYCMATLGKNKTGREHPRIVCAANIHNPTGRIALGVRHHDEIMNESIKAQGGWSSREQTQGFIDQFRCFHDREAAWKIALAAGQIIRRCGGDTINGGRLFSENLY